MNKKHTQPLEFLIAFIGRRMIVTLLSTVLLMSVLDLVGIAIIFPYLQIVSAPETFIRKWLPFYSADIASKDVLLWLSVGLIIFYVIKNFLQMRLTKHQFKSSAELTQQLTDDTISLVLNARYATFQKFPASEIVGVASSNTVHATLVFQALLQIINEIVFLGLLLIATFKVSPLLGLFSLVMVSLLAVGLYFFVIRRTQQLGYEQSVLNRKRYELQFSIVTAIRDIKVMGLGPLFDQRSRNVSERFSAISWKYSLNGALPRLYIELFMLLGFVCAIVMLALSGANLATMMPVFGVIAITAIRAIPSFSRLIAGVNSVKYSISSLEDLIDIRNTLADAAHTRHDDQLTFNEGIELRNICFDYGSSHILQNVSLRIQRGHSIGIVGPSGSGKTTLLDVITGLQPALSGEIYADGQAFNPFTSRSLEKLVGYVPQSITLLNESIAFNITFEQEHDAARLARVLSIANLESFVGSLPEGLNTIAGEDGLRLSGGQRQRIGIARALYREPQLLVFDEATSALDTISEEEISAEIESLRKTTSVVIVAHRLSTVVNCDVIYVLAHGYVVDQGTHPELLTRCSLYREMHLLQGKSDFDDSNR